MQPVRRNNFDFLRLLFASLVVVTHSFDLFDLREQEWLYRLTSGQTVLSWIAVKGFFIISGFLIFQSLERSPSLLVYFKKRMLRLFPGLFVVLCLTVLLVPFVYEGGTPFWLNRAVWTYVPNNLSLYRLQNYIGGVFEHNPVHYVNASLWTLMYEFSMYTLLAGLFFFRRNIRVVKALLWVLFAVFVLLTYRPDLVAFHFLKFDLDQLTEMGAYFLAGALCSAYKFDRLRQKTLLALLLLSGSFIALSFATNTFFYTKDILLPVFVLSLGLCAFDGVSKVGQYGDYSYGMYLYAFPIQQTLLHFFRLTPLSLMGSAFLLTFPFAFASWHLVEKRALRLKKRTPPPVLRTGEIVTVKSTDQPVTRLEN